MESAGDVFIPYTTVFFFFFGYRGGDREVADVAILGDLGPTQMS
jgi:hypothetical protein